MKKFLLIAVSALLVMSVTGNLYAMERECSEGLRGRHMEGQRCGNHMPFLDKLNLTDEQTAKIKSLREAYLKDVKPLQDKMFSKRGDLKLLWLQTNLDKEKILAIRKEIRVLRDQIEDKATAHHVDVFNLLTPEQKNKIQAAGRGPFFGPCMEGKGMMGHHSPEMKAPGKRMMKK
jgi:Spy/CpxP family protein refolding chaperone